MATTAITIITTSSSNSYTCVKLRATGSAIAMESKSCSDPVTGRICFSRFLVEETEAPPELAGTHTLPSAGWSHSCPSSHLPPPLSHRKLPSSFHNSPHASSFQDSCTCSSSCLEPSSATPIHLPGQFISVSPVDPPDGLQHAHCCPPPQKCKA